MWWIRCVHCKKLQRDFVARTFALIEPVQYVLQQVSCSYGMIPNAPKYYETHLNISLGSNGVDQVRSLQKITTWLHGTNFCINCTSSVCFAISFMQLRNDPKYTQLLRNAPKLSLGYNGVDPVRFVVFGCISDRFVTAWNLLQNIMNWCNQCKSSCHKVTF